MNATIVVAPWLGGDTAGLFIRSDEAIIPLSGVDGGARHVDLARPPALPTTLCEAAGLSRDIGILTCHNSPTACCNRERCHTCRRTADGRIRVMADWSMADWSA